jgi:nucleotide-binding universal stress UspA family protein
MARDFKSILVPADFSKNTDIAVSRALSLCPGGGTLHLLHVQQTGHGNAFLHLKTIFRGYSWKIVQAGRNASETKLAELKRSIEAARHDVRVYTGVCYGETVEQMISKKAVDLAVDLVVVGKHSRHSSLPHLNTVTPSKLALATGIPVLTVKPGSLYNTLKKVVIPVGIDFPAQKIAIMEALHNDPGPEILLVVFPYDKTNRAYSKQALLNTFKALKSRSANPVRYDVLEGKNKARALADYCTKIEADMVIVHPGTETRVGTWMNSHISDLLPANSRTQVLTVKAAGAVVV